MGWAAKRGNKYRAMYRDSEGRMKSAGTFTRKRDAESAADDAESRTRQQHNNLTWSAWAETWMPTRQLSPATLQHDKREIEKRIEPKWGDTLLEDITQLQVKQWVAELNDEGLKPNTVTKVFRVFSGSMRAALNAELIASNPCQGVKLPSAGPTPDRFLTDSECDVIRKYLDDEWTILFDLLLGTGMRFGEGLALHWEDVDMRAKTIDVYWSFDRVALQFKPPKSGRSRTVPISDSLVASLRSRKKADGIPSAAYPYMGSRRPHSGLVVGSLNYAGWGYAWRAAVKVATVQEGGRSRKVGRARTQDLRHTYASRLAQKGVPLVEIQRLLGHQSVTTTERYARLVPDQFDLVRKYL